MRKQLELAISTEVIEELKSEWLSNLGAAAMNCCLGVSIEIGGRISVVVVDLSGIF